MMFKITFKNITHVRTSPFLLQRKSLGLTSHHSYIHIYIWINVCDVNVGGKFYSHFFCDGENEELQEVHIAVTDDNMNTDFI